MFLIGEVDALLYDADGNPIVTVDDSGTRRVPSINKVLNSGGSQINPSTEDTLSTRASESTLATRASESTLSTRASEATLLAADGRLTTIDAVLDSIKDTDGIKKITDQLPAGTNEIGKVAQGTKAAAADGWPLYLVDNAGHVVGVVLDGAIYRLQADAKIAKGASDLVHLDAIDTASGRGRLEATLLTQAGDPVSFPSVSESIKNDFVLNAGSSDLRVDGSITPVIFEYLADATHDLALQEIRFTIAANSITFGTDYFGSKSGPLTNGMLVEVVVESGTVVLYNLIQNESFVNFSSPGGFEWVVSSKDMMTSCSVIGGGLVLRSGSADKVRVTVRDDLSSAAVYFKCYVKGNLAAD